MENTQNWIELDLDFPESRDEEVIIIDDSGQQQVENQNQQEDNIEDQQDTQESQQETNEQVKEEEEKEDKEKEFEVATLEDYINALKETAGIDEETLSKIETIDDLLELNAQVIEAKVEEQLNLLTNRIGDIGVRFLKYVASGGNPVDFIKQVGDIVASDTDISFVEGDEANHERIIRMYMQEKGLSEDDIRDTIEGFKEAGKLEEKAKQYYEKLKEILQQKKDRILEEQRKRQEEEKKRREEFAKRILEELDSSSELYGYRLSEKEKEELRDYIVSARVQLDNGTFISEFQRDLNELLTEPKNIITLGLLAKHKFNLDFIKKKLESEVAKKTKKIISRSTIPKQQQQNKSILDLLEKL